MNGTRYERPWTPLFAYALAAALTVPISASSCTDRDLPEFRDELASLQSRTTHSSGRVLWTGNPSFERATLAVAWESESRLSHEEFESWVSTKLTNAGWQPVREHANTLSFVKRESGELHVLDIEQGSAPSRARFALKIVPD